MATHEENLLAAIISKENPRRDLLASAILRLEPDHFTQDQPKNIFLLLRSYFDTTGEVMSLETFTQKLNDNGVEASKILSYSQKFSVLQDTAKSPADFQWSLQEMRELYAKRMTGVAITESMEILERGYEVNRKLLKGHEDARAYLTSRVHEIDRLGEAESVPEGNIFTESQDIIADYLSRRDGQQGQGIFTGISTIDDRTGGMNPGELVLTAGSYGTGKSMISTQAAWSCAVEQAKNVYFATSETIRAQVIRRILARHSRLAKFGKPEGLNSADLKRGRLSEPDEKLLYEVVNDWEDGQATGKYGELYLIQIPRGGKLDFVENRLREYGREREVGLCVIDYLALLKPSIRRNSEREEFNEILRDAKLMAVHQNVPVLSPWQVSRDAHDAALRTGAFGPNVLADTSEAEKSADQIMAIIREQDNHASLSLQFLKMRDDALPPITELAIDLRSTYIGPRLASTSLSGPAHTSFDLESMMGNL